VINVPKVFLGSKHAVRAIRPCGAAARWVDRQPVFRGRSSREAGIGSYCASKGALRLLSKAAALEFAALGYEIRVNSLHPAIFKIELGTFVVRGFADIGLVADKE